VANVLKKKGGGKGEEEEAANSVCRAMKRKIRCGEPCPLVDALLVFCPLWRPLSLPPTTPGVLERTSLARLPARTRARLFTDSTFEESQELEYNASLSSSSKEEWAPTVALARGVYGPVE